MSDPQNPGFPAHPRPDEGDPIAPLLRLAGPRETVPADRKQRVRAAVHAKWAQQTRARWRRVTIGWSLSALAAAALVLVALRLTAPEDAAPPSLSSELATIETLAGAVHMVASSERAAEPALFQVGDRIRVGEGVDTASGGLAALRLSGGVSVRVDRGSTLRLLSDTTLVLETGAIYVDSGHDRGGALEIRTPLGVARDIGTRFEVRLNGSALRVRVRDGLVQLSQGRQSHEANPGDELTLDRLGGIVRRSVPVYGADWDWAVALARPFDLEGRSLRNFLDWIAEENGWQLRFADAGVEQKARTTILHGSILGLTPNEALLAVLPTSGVDGSLENGVLRIQLSAGGARD